jgi:hypothetical protein
MLNVHAYSTLHTISKGRSARGHCNGVDVLSRFDYFPFRFFFFLWVQYADLISASSIFSR